MMRKKMNVHLYRQCSLVDDFQGMRTATCLGSFHSFMAEYASTSVLSVEASAEDMKIVPLTVSVT